MRKVKGKEIVLSCFEDLFFYALYHIEAYWEVGEISNYTANRIKQSYNINLKGYKIMLSSSELVHFLNSHFSEKWIGQKCINSNDIKDILSVINNHVRLYIGNKNNTLLFEKKNPNNLCQLVVVIDERKKRLLGKSFRIKT